MPKWKRGNVYSTNSTTGTFLNGLIHIGEKQIPAGRYDEKPSTGLSEQLENLISKLEDLKPEHLQGWMEELLITMI